MVKAVALALALAPESGHREIFINYLLILRGSRFGEKEKNGYMRVCVSVRAYHVVVVVVFLNVVAQPRGNRMSERNAVTFHPTRNDDENKVRM